MIRFIEKEHKYISDEGEEWRSVTELISKYKNPFNAEEVARKVSKKRDSKWFGIKPNIIIQAWEKEKERSIILGNWYHKQREKDINECTTIKNKYKELKIYKPIYEDNVKIAREQKLISGIYPEHLVYLQRLKLCGQIDYVEVVNGYVNITDYKTYKELKYESIKDWRGRKIKMLSPLSGLDDVNYIHACLQLSIYMYMIIKHNPNLKRGKLTIQHVIFEEEETKDEYGFPLIKYNMNGPIIKEIKYIDCPYLKYEINAIL